MSDILLSSEVIAQKNTMGSEDAFLVCLEIVIPDITEHIRLVSNTEDIIWQGHTWLAFPFELDEISDQTEGEIPRVDLRIPNVNRDIESYLQEYDRYVKQNGPADIEVTIYIVSSATLDDPTPVVSHDYILIQPISAADYVTFTLGAPNIYRKRFPLNRILKNSCRFKFKSDRCGYTGTATTCNKTLSRCRELDNSTRFGGFPGVGRGGLTIAS
jgi:lambda family phage minor tail protein L